MASSTTARVPRIVAGLAIAGLGIALAFMPLMVAGALSRPHETSSQMINLRASWGGTLLGLGLFVAWLESLRPIRRMLIGLVMWSMVGIAAARLLGFVLDGGPDAAQWVWLILEIILVAVGAFALRRNPSGARA